MEREERGTLLEGIGTLGGYGIAMFHELKPTKLKGLPVFEPGFFKL